MKYTSRVVTVLLLLAAVVAFSGCGSSSSSSGNNTLPGAGLSVTGASGNPVNMSGTWGNCSFDTGGPSDNKATIAVSGSGFTFTSSMWATNTTQNCTETATPDLRITGTGTVTLGATHTAVWMNGSTPTTAPSGLATALATAATIHFTSQTAVAGSAAMVADLNTGNVCGGGWVINQSKDVSSCSDFFGGSATQSDYWVVDDTGSPLKWYTSNDNGATQWGVDVTNPMLK